MLCALDKSTIGTTVGGEMSSGIISIWQTYDSVNPVGKRPYIYGTQLLVILHGNSTLTWLSLSFQFYLPPRLETAHSSRGPHKICRPPTPQHGLGPWAQEVLLVSFGLHATQTRTHQPLAPLLKDHTSCPGQILSFCASTAATCNHMPPGLLAMQLSKKRRHHIRS